MGSPMAMVGRIWTAHPGGFIFGSGLMGSMITFHRPSKGWNFEDGWAKWYFPAVNIFSSDGGVAESKEEAGLDRNSPGTGDFAVLKSKGVWV
ncbi:hypothetical protein U1Q18_036443 [Sarracenia purpurea var. burkii]